MLKFLVHPTNAANCTNRKHVNRLREYILILFVPIQVYLN